MIDDRAPDPALGSGFGRMYEAVTQLAGQFEVTFIATLAPQPTDQPWLARRLSATQSSLSDLGVHLRLGDLDYIPRENPEFDVILLSRPTSFDRAGKLIERYLPSVPVVYDTEALWSLRMARQAALANGRKARRLLRQSKQIGTVEKSAVSRSDVVVAVSDEEANLIRAMKRHAQVAVISSAGMQPQLARKGFDSRRPFIIFASSWLAGADSPNIDALRWIADQVMPIVVASVPWVRLLVTGACPPATVMALESPTIDFTGFVSDLNALYSTSRVAVSPALFGSGVKIKTIEALSHGLPVVATSVGAEGIVEAGGGALAIADDPSAFARLCVTRLTDKASWEAAHAEALIFAIRHGQTPASTDTWVSVLRAAAGLRRG